MREDQRHPARGESAVRQLPYRTLREVPIGDVIAIVAQDGDIRKHARHKVYPLLIGEQATLEIHEAAELEFVGPPIHQCIRFRMRAVDRCKAAVVDTAAHDRKFVGEAIVLDRRIQMRRQHGQRAAFECLLDFIQPAQYQDVGIEIDDARARMPFAQPREHVRLDRRVQLHDVVAEHERIEMRQWKLVDRDRFEQIGIQRGITRARIGQTQVSWCIRILLCQRLHQRQRIRKVIARDDGEKDGFGHSGSFGPSGSFGHRNLSHRKRHCMRACSARTSSSSRFPRAMCASSELAYACDFSSESRNESAYSRDVSSDSLSESEYPVAARRAASIASRSVRTSAASRSSLVSSDIAYARDFSSALLSEPACFRCSFSATWRACSSSCLRARRLLISASSAAYARSAEASERSIASSCSRRRRKASQCSWIADDNTSSSSFSPVPVATAGPGMSRSEDSRIRNASS